MLIIQTMNAIKDFCKNKQIKIKDFAGILKIPPTYLSQIIIGYRRPSPELAAKIEQATGGQVSRLELLYPEKQGVADKRTKHGASDEMA